MKENIKNILRENVNKNVLGVMVTRPDQELIIMSGIPGSGKSTKAKSLVGEGKMHSTDDLICEAGDYRAFFVDMVEKKDFLPLSRMHSKNLKNAIESMKLDITPVIVDNTNIKLNESKAYVVAALELGYADNNIKFVDIGTGGLVAEGLASRNTHGVPLEKIKAMIASCTARGPLTLNSVLEAKDMYKQSDVHYSAVVLDTASKTKLLDMVHDKIPQGWTPFAHHMTIVFGKGVNNKEDLGKKVTLTVTHVGWTDKVIAVQVEGYESANKVPHITVAVNTAGGGKPVMSNDITNWQNVKPFMLMGVVTEVKKNKS